MRSLLQNESVQVRDVVYRFIKEILIEYEYCRKVMKEHFKKKPCLDYRRLKRF